MQYGLTEEQEMIAATVRSFVENEIYPHEDIVERTGEVPAEIAAEIKRKTIELGFYACNFPEEVGGAGLDVQAQEPPDPDNPLLKLDNVLLTPHSAALTKECVIRMATDAADRALEVLADIKPINVANPEVLACRRWRHLKER